MQNQYDTPSKILERVKEVLQTIPDSEFSMRAWKQQTDCGTVACAWGHALMKTPEFKCDWSLIDTQGDYSKLLYRNQTPPNLFDSLADYIGISKSDVEYLFDPSSYPGVKGKDIFKAKVIARINKLLKKLSKVTK